MHLFEFMDQAWVPSSLRATMRDILECGNSWPFRRYNDWVAAEIIRVSKERGAATVIELGAGTAPLTRLLLRRPDADNLNLIVCDSNPDADGYRELEKESNGRVQPIYSPVDFSQPHQWPTGALLVLSATLHHVPARERSSVLNALRSNGNRVLVFEPLRHSIWSMLFVGLSLVPALLTPLRYLGRAGRLRRILWCWLLPVAPIMFWWDGVISCFRQWRPADWDRSLTGKKDQRPVWAMQTWFFSQLIEISGVAVRAIGGSCGSAHPTSGESSLKPKIVRGCFFRENAKGLLEFVTQGGLYESMYCSKNRFPLTTRDSVNQVASRRRRTLPSPAATVNPSPQISMEAGSGITGGFARKSLSSTKPHELGPPTRKPRGLGLMLPLYSEISWNVRAPTGSRCSEGTGIKATVGNIPNASTLIPARSNRGASGAPAAAGAKSK